jgi:hypothetical protein
MAVAMESAIEPIMAEAIVVEAAMEAVEVIVIAEVCFGTAALPRLAQTGNVAKPEAPRMWASFRSLTGTGTAAFHRWPRTQTRECPVERFRFVSGTRIRAPHPSLDGSGAPREVLVRIIGIPPKRNRVDPIRFSPRLYRARILVAGPRGRSCGRSSIRFFRPLFLRALHQDG